MNFGFLIQTIYCERIGLPSRIFRIFVNLFNTIYYVLFDSCKTYQKINIEFAHLRTNLDFAAPLNHHVSFIKHINLTLGS